MLKSPASFAIIALIAASIGPIADAHPAEIQRLKAGLSFRGDINEESVSKLQDILKPNDVLLVDSNLGDPTAAISLSKTILERHVSVVVNGVCGNVCALYVFLIARSRTAAIAASVRFGLSPFALEKEMELHPETFSPQELAESRHLGSKYRMILEEANISAALIRCIDDALQPDYSARALRRSSEQENLIDMLPTEFSGAVLSKELLQRFAVKIEGTYDWYVNLAERSEYSSEFRIKLAWISGDMSCGMV